MTFTRRTGWLLLVASLLVIDLGHAQDPQGSRPDETPHFWQLDPRGGFENGGRDYCCPVAISNSLVYLARQGFPSLAPGENGKQAQIDLINTLASKDYFGTDPAIGTGPGDVLVGLKKYVENCGYRCEELAYKGWRSVGRKEQDHVKGNRPDLAWLKSAISNPHGAVWLNIGWYKKNGENRWKRDGGHWVTLVGFDPNNPETLWIHNPLTRGNGDQPDDPAKDVIYLQQVSAGTLETGKTSTENAAGMYQVSGPALPLARGVDAAFLDDAIVLVIAH
jgi:hypothetical protein